MEAGRGERGCVDGGMGLGLLEDVLQSREALGEYVDTGGVKRDGHFGGGWWFLGLIEPVRLLERDGRV